MTFLFEYVSYYIIIILFNDFLNFFSFNLFVIIFHKSRKIVNCFEYFILLFLILINYDFLENSIFSFHFLQRKLFFSIFTVKFCGRIVFFRMEVHRKKIFPTKNFGSVTWPTNCWLWFRTGPENHFWLRNLLKNIRTTETEKRVI